VEPNPRETVLLSEYERCHTEVERLNSQLWTTAQILIPLSLAGVGLLFSLSQHDLQSLSSVVVLSFVSSLVLLGWLKIAHRWHGYQSIAQFRMIEIERDLDMWCTRYELEATGRTVSGTPITGTFDDILPDRYQRVPVDIIRNGTSTIIVTRRLVYLLVLSWGLLLVREILLVCGLF
jgi:uncharacterized membrane protein